MDGERGRRSPMEKVIHPPGSTWHPDGPRLLRVAAYARVSSGKEAMLHSLSRADQLLQPA